MTSRLRVQYYIGACGQPATKLGEEPCRRCLGRFTETSWFGSICAATRPHRRHIGRHADVLSMNHNPTSSVRGVEAAGNELIKNSPVGSYVVLPGSEGRASNSRLKQLARWAGPAGLAVKGNGHHGLVGRDIKQLCAVVAPSRLPTAPVRDSKPRTLCLSLVVSLGSKTATPT